MANLPKLDDIRYFYAIVQATSMSHAATRLGVRQSTLSTAMQRLETVVGQSLFIRRGKTLALTKAGETFRRDASGMFDRWHDIKAKINDQPDEFHDTFSIACHHSIGLLIIPDVMALLVHQYPQMQFRIRTEYSGSASDLVLNYKVDFALTGTPHPHPELRSHTLMDGKIGLWKKANLDWDENTPLLVDPQTLGLSHVYRSLARKKHHFRRQIEVGNLEIVASMVKKGVGIGVLPVQVIRAQKGVKFEQVLPYVGYRSPISLIYRHSASQGQAAAAVIEGFRSVFTA